MNSENNQIEENYTPITPEGKIKQQKIGLIIFGAVFGTIVLILSFVDMGGGIKSTKELEVNSDYEITIADPTKNIKAEDRWLVNAQDRLGAQESDIKKTIQENERLKRELEEIKENKTLGDRKFQELESKIDALISRNSVNIKAAANNYPSNQSLTNNRVDVNRPLIETVSFGDGGDEEERAVYDVSDGYVPATSYAAATIISSADVQVGVNTTANPKPVLIKITGKAKSAFFKNKQLSVDIKGCKISAGAIGELSSEKVYIKLSKMVCAISDTEVIEIPVKGYVSAAGSSGARGRVVSREGDLVAKSLLAGMISGIGSAYSQSLAPPLVFGGGTTTQESISAKDAGKRGLGVGIESSSSALSNFLIEKAKQYQPVITVPSGIDVEVVFLEGFYADGRITKKGSNDNSSKN
jgi:conjugal transfer pilus assembly protein TraB